VLDPQNILTPQELAERLKVPLSWVFEKTRARCRNPIPCLRIGLYIRFDWIAVAAWLESQGLEATKANHKTAGLVTEAPLTVHSKRRDHVAAGA
jgi:hypothetical protein